MSAHRFVIRRALLIGFFVGLLAAAPASALDPARSIAQMFHRTYTRDEGLPGTVHSITQTPDGYLWVGTDRGLFRFDGLRFERIAADSLPSPNIQALTATRSGDLWMGYQTGGLSRLRNGVVVNYPVVAHGAFRTIFSIMEAKGGALWAMAGYTLLRFDGKTWREMSGPWAAFTGQDSSGVWWSRPAQDGTMWAKSRDGVFYCRPGCTRFLAARGYAGGVMGFAQDPAGRIWTSDTRAPGHMYAMPDIGRVSDAAIPEPAYGGQISGRFRGRILIDRDGTVWNPDPHLGLLRTRSIVTGRADPGQVEIFGEANGLSSNTISALYEDREGSIWVATDEGLDRFRPADVVLERQLPVRVTVYGYNAVAAGNALFFFASTTNDMGRVFNGSSGPLYRLNADGSIQLILPETGQPYALRPADDGGLWIGTQHGLQKLRNGVLGTEPMPEGAQGVVLDVAETAAGELFVSTLSHGIWRRANGAWSHVAGRPDEMGPWPIIAFDAKGELWLIDHDHIGRYTNGRVREIPGTPRPNIGAFEVMNTSAHGMWFGGESGLAFYDGRRFYAIPSRRLPALAEVSGIVESNGQTWIASQAGILHFDTGALERAMTHPDASAPAFELFDRRDGVSGEMQHDAPQSSSDFLGPDGRIWFLTDHGIVWIDPHHIYHNSLRPPVAIRSLSAGGRSYTSPGNLDLPAGTSSLQIDYAALSMSEPSRVHFRYRLDGVDADWVDPGQRRQAFYTQLGPGSYVFRVIASNDAGVWNRTGAKVSFTIAPTFIQSIWFKLLAALVLAGLAWLAYAWRVRHVTALLQDRFDVRIAERERIARELHDTLLQGCQGLLLQFQSIANRLPADNDLHGRMENALTRADAILAEGRARVRELRSSGDTADLAQALGDAALNITGGEPPVVHLTVEGAQPPLNIVMREELQKIFEEAVRNAVAHARATRIDVVLSYVRHALRLSVRDDGIGMPHAKTLEGQSGHFGLVGMRERVERIGGRLEITSREGDGTEVAVSVPSQLAYRRPRRSWPHIGRATSSTDFISRDR